MSQSLKMGHPITNGANGSVSRTSTVDGTQRVPRQNVVRNERPLPPNHVLARRKELEIVLRPKFHFGYFHKFSGLHCKYNPGSECWSFFDKFLNLFTLSFWYNKLSDRLSCHYYTRISFVLYHYPRRHIFGVHSIL